MRKFRFTNPNIYKLKSDYVMVIPQLSNVNFFREWVSVDNGELRINQGYAWDGCSPKFTIFDLFVIGTPDGRIDVDTDKPMTWEASLVHDALLQYQSETGLSRQQIDEIFVEMLTDAGFASAKLYGFGLKIWRMIRRLK